MESVRYPINKLTLGKYPQLEHISAHLAPSQPNQIKAIIIFIDRRTYIWINI